MKTSILFLLPYPLQKAPSQRFRVEAFFPILKENKITYRTHEFLDEKAWAILYNKGSIVQKVSAVLKGFFKRLFVVLFIAPQYQYIFVHREASPIGPPVFEWILTSLLRKKIIYDFDDSIWIPNVTDTNQLARYIKCFWKVKLICKWSYKVSAGNSFLADWAKQYNDHVFVIPTCVDVLTRYNIVKYDVDAIPQPAIIEKTNGKVIITHRSNEDMLYKNRVTNKGYNTNVVIGWTGSHSTLIYLDMIYPVLQKLEQEFDFDFLVICDKKPSFHLHCLKYVPWQESTEIEDLFKVDIGIMPLIDDAWSEGKCGFKIIQYMALGIPAVASPIGVNKDIIEDGRNGVLCRTESEWYDALYKLLIDRFVRAEMGKAGREKIVREYSVQANTISFLSFFNLGKEE